MAAKDKIHDLVVRALGKEGWRVEDEQIPLVLPTRILYLDLLISHPESQRILYVEIKTFDSQSPVMALAPTLGKQLIYTQALALLKSQIPLMFAIPDTSFRGIFGETWLKPVLTRINMHLIGISIAKEEVVGWT